MTDPVQPQQTVAALDPAEWDELRRLGHRMMDDVIDGFRTLRERPVWQPVPEAARNCLRSGLPAEAMGAEAAYGEFRTHVGPYSRGNCHPRFWGWVNGSGLPVGVLAELLAAAMNPSLSGFENAASLVEEQVLDWLKQMLGFRPEISALLTSGCSMSNIIALAVARSAKSPVDIRRLGVAAAPGKMVLYGSVETHSSIRKAVELLGLGSDALRCISVSDDFRLDVNALEREIEKDRSEGCQPFCVIANAGTVNTGAIDDLSRLADLCEAHGLWLHVDGAFGALAWLCPDLRPSLQGLQRADSLAFDLHKWMYLPYDVGCVFVQDAKAHRDTFAVSPSYLAPTAQGPASRAMNFADYGIELTRRFRALKVWFALKAHGVDAFALQIRKNVTQANYLAGRIAEHPHLELAAPVQLNVVCFRYNNLRHPAAQIDRLNRDLLLSLQSSGIALPSHTVLNGRFAIRAAITNHRSADEDFDVLVSAVVKLGNELSRAWD